MQNELDAGNLAWEPKLSNHNHGENKMKAASKWIKVHAAGRTFYRFVIAHLNRAQYDMRSEDYVQSFHPRFRIIESGDYTAPQVEIPRDIQADMRHLGLFPTDLTPY